ncbi:MAG: hypothetical protein KGD74_07010 [Candidatus Lokiarchaeota archaeon]|nr:hypothetical protein [Candidatus Lokiarchaeota archaeon]
MKVKKRDIYTSIILLLLFILGFSSNVFALEYQNGIKTDDELIWNCHICDNNKMDALFGDNWNQAGIFENLSANRRMKWKVNMLEENSTTLSAIFNIWMWNFEDNWGTQDNSSKLSYLKNPSLYPEDFNFTDVLPFIPFWLPVPVGEYLGEVALGDIYDIDNRVLPTINVQIIKDSIHPNEPTETVYFIVVYNSNGILSSFKLYTQGNVVVVDISLDNLPIFVIPSTIGLILTFICSIVLYIKKKRIN